MTLRCFPSGSHFMGRLSSLAAAARRAPPLFDGRHTNARTLFSNLTISPPSRGASVEVPFARSAPAGVCGVRVLFSSVLSRVSTCLVRGPHACYVCRALLPAARADVWLVRALISYKWLQKYRDRSKSHTRICRAYTDTTNHGGLPLRRSQIVARTPRTTRSRRGPALARTL